MTSHSRRHRPRFDALEVRLALSLPPGSPTYGLTPPANAIGLSLGDAANPHAVSATTVTVAPKNITPGKKSTEFGVFVQPNGDSGIVPQIVAVKEGGKTLPLQHARDYLTSDAGQAVDQSVAFFEAKKPGTVTILVSGQGLSTGAYTVVTTLVGDVNGDGQVNLADEQAFAKTYGESAGDKDYKASADYNQNGVINLYDALALERNMPPLDRRYEGLVAIHLAPQDQIHFSGTTNSGGVTMKADITIEGYAEPGSLVLVDSKDGTYTFGSQALATNAKGFFSVPAQASGNTAGVITYNFKVVDPFGHQYIRSFPVVWVPFSMPNSPYVYKPSKPHKYGTGKFASSSVPINAP